MESDELLKKLESLAQLDTDAVEVYREAIERTDQEDVRTEFGRFQGEHRYHAEQLSAAIVRLGGKKPELKVDLMGHVAEWVTAFRSMLGKMGPLHAMQTAEHYHNRRYDDAASWEVMDPELEQLLRRFQGDEKGHLSYIEKRLQSES